MDLKDYIPTTDCRQTLWNVTPGPEYVRYPDWRLSGPSPSYLVELEADEARDTLDKTVRCVFRLPQTARFTHFGWKTMAYASWWRAGDDSLDRSVFLYLSEASLLSPAVIDQIEEHFFSIFPTWRILVECHDLSEGLNNALTLYPNTVRFEADVVTGSKRLTLVDTWRNLASVELAERYHFLSSMWLTIAHTVAHSDFATRPFPRVVCAIPGSVWNAESVLLWIAFDRECDIELKVIRPDVFSNLDLHCGVNEDLTLAFGSRFERWGLAALEIQPQFVTGSIIVEVDGCERDLHYAF